MLAKNRNFAINKKLKSVPQYEVNKRIIQNR